MSKRTTVSLDENIYKELKILAIKNNLNFSDLINKVLKDFLKK